MDYYFSIPQPAHKNSATENQNNVQVLRSCLRMKATRDILLSSCLRMKATRHLNLGSAGHCISDLNRNRQTQVRDWVFPHSRKRVMDLWWWCSVSCLVGRGGAASARAWPWRAQAPMPSPNRPDATSGSRMGRGGAMLGGRRRTPEVEAQRRG